MRHLGKTGAVASERNKTAADLYSELQDVAETIERLHAQGIGAAVLLG